MKVIDSVEGRIRDGVRITKFSAKFGALFLQELAEVTIIPWSERLLGPPDTDNFKAESAENAAAVGIRAMHYGRSIGEEEVERMGAAMAVRAAVVAEKDDDVPGDVVEGIVQSIASADIDPTQNPFLKDAEVAIIEDLTIVKR